RDCAEDWVFCLRALKAGLRFRWVDRPDLVCHKDGANTTASAEVSTKHVLGALELIQSERLVGPERLAQTRRFVHARASGLEAYRGNVRRATHHAYHASFGMRERSIARQ